MNEVNWVRFALYPIGDTAALSVLTDAGFHAPVWPLHSVLMAGCLFMDQGFGMGAEGKSLTFVL